MSLFDVKHQIPAQRLLQRAMASDRVPHAYLFHGPEGVGREMLAVGLAQLLVCEAPVVRPLASTDANVLDAEAMRVGCDRCASCRLLAAGTHPDVHLIYRQLHREHSDQDVRKRKGQSLSIDVIREFLIAPAGLKPACGRGKVFVVRESQLLEAPAQNAVLKTLEEPPPNTFIVLLTDSIDDMLRTTRSRCQPVALGPLPATFVQQRLCELRPESPPDQVAWYARVGDGSLGRSLQWLDDDVFAINERVVQSLVGSRADRIPDIVKLWTESALVLAKLYRKRDPEITETVAKRAGFNVLFQFAAIWFADVLKVAVGSSAPATNAAHAPSLNQCADAIDPKYAGAAIRRIAEAEYHLKRYLYTDLAVETLLGDLLHVMRGDPIRTL